MKLLVGRTTEPHKHQTQLITKANLPHLQSVLGERVNGYRAILHQHESTQCSLGRGTQ